MTRYYRTYALGDTIVDSRSMEGDGENQAFRVDLLYVRYPNPGAAVNWYWGAGPSMRYLYSESTSGGLYDDSRTITDRSQSESWSLGATGSLGADWFASKNVSLHAEYYLTLLYTESDSEQRNQVTGDEDNPAQTNEVHRERKAVVFDGANVLLGLSLYF